MDERKINGYEFRALLSGGLGNLKANAEEINGLNVFPIPDGDTGDNMVSTMAGGLRALSSEEEGVGAAAERAADGMLLGARGNSGVILSQMFSGVAKSLSGKSYADVAALGAAFKEGTRCAYASLSEPVEGTILTVMRRAADYAAERIDINSTVESYFSDYESEAAAALEQTPDLLYVLKEAGTVDSGGAGLLAIVRGFLAVMRGGAQAYEESAAALSNPHSAPDISLFTEDSVLTYGYCTEFLLRLTNAKTDVGAFSIEDFRERLAGIGNSVVAFKQGSIVKVHIHVMQPWRVMQLAQEYGEFLTVKVENMNIQHSEAQEKKQPAFRRRGVRRPYGVVAVGCGEGLCAAYKELGADIVIDGEECGNPSVELLLKAIDAVNADCVYLLPNNSNVIIAAEEAASMCRGCKVMVLPTHNTGEGYVALSALGVVLLVLFAFGTCFFALSRTASGASRPVVVLDAGHGGIDAGVTGALTGVRESDLNLAVVRILQEKFEGAGFETVLTRRSEAGLYGTTAPGHKKRDMAKRAEIIQKASPVLVLSIHMNAFSSPERRGAQAFYRLGLSSSKELACALQSALNAMPECVKRTSPVAGDYFILNCCDCPSAIVECGFLSNPADEELLVTQEYREKLASAILAGALTYLSSAT